MAKRQNKKMQIVKEISFDSRGELKKHKDNIFQIEKNKKKKISKIKNHQRRVLKKENYHFNKIYEKDIFDIDGQYATIEDGINKILTDQTLLGKFKSFFSKIIAKMTGNKNSNNNLNKQVISMSLNKNDKKTDIKLSVPEIVNYLQNSNNYNSKTALEKLKEIPDIEENYFSDNNNKMNLAKTTGIIMLEGKVLGVTNKEIQGSKNDLRSMSNKQIIDAEIKKKNDANMLDDYIFHEGPIKKTPRGYWDYALDKFRSLNKNMKLGEIIHSNPWKINEWDNYVEEFGSGTQTHGKKKLKILKTHELGSKLRKLTYDKNKNGLVDQDGNLASTIGSISKEKKDTMKFILYKGNEINMNVIDTSETDHDPFAFVSHASLSGGERVEGAGLIKIENGKISYINDSSGHYRPDLYDMYRVVKRLQKEGLFTEGAIINRIHVSDDYVTTKNESVEHFLKSHNLKDLKNARIRHHEEEKLRLKNMNTFAISGKHKNLESAINSIFPSMVSGMQKTAAFVNKEKEKRKELLGEMILERPDLRISFIDNNNKENKFRILEVKEYLENLDNKDSKSALRKLNIIGLDKRNIKSGYLNQNSRLNDMKNEQIIDVEMKVDVEMEEKNDTNMPDDYILLEGQKIIIPKKNNTRNKLDDNGPAAKVEDDTFKPTENKEIQDSENELESKATQVTDNPRVKNSNIEHRFRKQSNNNYEIIGSLKQSDDLESDLFDKIRNAVKKPSRINNKKVLKITKERNRGRKGRER